MERANFNEMKQHMSLLNNYGVPVIELRILKVLNKNNNSNSNFFKTNNEGIEEAIDWIKKNEYQQGTINCSYNLISQTSLGKGKYLADSDVACIRLLMIDIDPIKGEKGQSASNEEKERAMSKAKEVGDYLKEQGIPYAMKIDSGNGVHLFILIEQAPVDKVKNLHKVMLEILQEKFDDDFVTIDTTVSNPSRIGKLVGSPATKGEDTVDRPHRLSCFLDIVEDPVEVTIEVLQSFVNKNKPQSSKNKSSHKKMTNKKDYVIADAKKWLDYYELPYSIKEDESTKSELLVLECCPLKKHSNNQNGASISVGATGKCRFRCLHASHEKITIHDFCKIYPIPEEAKINVGIQGASSDPVNLNGLEEGTAFQVGNFTISKKGIYKYKDGMGIRISDAMFITQVTINKESNIIEMELNYLLNEEWHSIMIGGDELQYGIFKRLSKHGLTFISQEEYNVIDFLNEQKKQALYRYEHSRIGWVLEKEKIIYQGKKSYGHTDTQTESLLSKKNMYKLEEQGSIEVFNDLLQKEIVGTTMELALCIGLSPIVLGYLNVSGEREITNLIVNLMGKSSTGKTTAIKVIASLYGDITTIIRNFNATQNSIIKLAANNYGGVPLILDELGASNLNNLSSLLYQFSLGEEKLRMKGSEFVEQQKFTALTIMTSEEALSSYLDRNLDGLKVRNLEFRDISWTKSGVSAEKISQIVRKNSGFVSPLFIEKLYEQGLSIIVERFDQSKKELLSKMVENPLKTRIANNLALIHSSGVLAKELLHWDINLSNIETHLIQAYDEILMDSEEEKVSVYEQVVELLVRNSSHFLQDNSKKISGEVWGKVKVTGEGVVVNVFASLFSKKVLRELEKKDVKAVVRQMLDEGKMRAESGRQTKRIQINKKPITTYEIILPKEAIVYFNPSYTVEVESQKQVNNTVILSKELSDEELEF